MLERPSSLSDEPAQNALLIGHWDAPTVSELRAILSPGLTAIDLPAAQALIHSGASHPERVIVWQSVPHEYPAGDIQELIGALPLTHWMVIFGPWCESIGRTEGLWPAGWCVPLRTALTRLKSRGFLPAIKEQDQAPVPATISRDESFALLTEWCRADPAERNRRVLIQSDDAVWSDCVTDNVRVAGYEEPDDENPELVLLLSTQVDESLRCRVQVSRKRFPLARLLVISDFARTGDEPALRAAGADAVLSALYFAEELQYALAR